MEWRNKVHLLRDDFFHHENQARRSDLVDEFTVMKNKLLEDFFAARPGQVQDGRPSSAWRDISITGGPAKGGAAGKEVNVSPVAGRETYPSSPGDYRGVNSYRPPDAEPRLGGSVATGSLGPVSTGSLENLYEKIKALKSEFQSVEQRMRSAVEALPPEKRAAEQKGDEAESDSARSKCGDSDYGSEPDSRVSSPVYPFLSPPPSTTPRSLTTNTTAGPPGRGTATVTDLPFPEWRQQQPDESTTSSSVSTPAYPHARSPTSSLNGYDSDSTLRPSSRLSHSQTYVQIPVVVRGGSSMVEASG